MTPPARTEAAAPHQGPIILFGTGRAGSTLAARLLGMHPDTWWLTGAAHYMPRVAAAQRLAFALRGPLRLPPIEAYRFWEAYAPGFARPHQDLTAADAAPVAPPLRRALAKRSPRGARRPLLKVTGQPRIQFLRHVWPDARFIHVTRELKATAASLLRAPFFDGRKGPGGWRYGPLAPDEDALWSSCARSQAGLAALAVRRHHRAAQEAMRHVPAHEIVYENLTSDPVQEVEAAATYAGLAIDDAFDAAVAQSDVRQPKAWDAYLTKEEASDITRILTDTAGALMQGRGLAAT